MPHPQVPHGCLVFLRFVIAARLRYQNRHKRVRLRDAHTLSQSGRVHPPTNVSGAYGAPGSLGAPSFFTTRILRLARSGSRFGLPAAIALGYTTFALPGMRSAPPRIFPGATAI